jgi:hypothetical protein
MNMIAWGICRGQKMRNLYRWLFLTLVAAGLAVAAFCAGCKAT